jgi:hypothetical protein
MQIALFSLPYDSARRGDRMGAGPLQLLKSGLAVRLEEEGHQVTMSSSTARGTQMPCEAMTPRSWRRSWD